MPARLTLQVVSGCARDFQMQVVNPTTGIPWTDMNPSPFLNTDALASVVSAGQDQPSVLTPTSTWLDALAATFQVSVSNAQTAALLPGLYRLQTTATRSGRSASIANARLEILSAMGTATAIPVYGTFADMLLYCSWIQDLQDDSDEAGFLKQRGRARQWLDDIIVAMFPWTGFGGSQLGDPGYGFAFGMWGGSDKWPTKWLRDILAANTGVGGATCLICYGPVIEAVSKRAIAYVLDDQVNRETADNPFKALAREFRRDSEAIVKCLRAELDVNASGYAGYVVNCGAMNLR